MWHLQLNERQQKKTANTFQKPTPEWDTIKKAENHVTFRNFLAEFIFTARTCQNLTPQSDPKNTRKHNAWMNEIQKKRKAMWHFNFFLWIGFHSQNLLKHTPQWDRKKTWYPCGALNLFYDSSPQPEPSRNLQLNERRGRQCGVLVFFVSSSPQPAPSSWMRSPKKHCRNLPEAYT